MNNASLNDVHTFLAEHTEGMQRISNSITNVMETALALPDERRSSFAFFQKDHEEGMIIIRKSVLKIMSTAFSLYEKQEELREIITALEAKKLLWETTEGMTPLPDHIRVFMITPYDDKFKPVERAVRNILEGAPYFFEVRLARDYTHEGAQLVYDLQRHIAESHAFIADITGFNPNVMMEVGAVHLRQDPRPLFLLISDTQVIDNSIADLGDKLRIPYGSPSDDVANIERVIRDKLKRREDLKKLLSQRKEHYLSDTLLSSLPRLGLNGDEIESIKEFQTVETLLKALEDNMVNVKERLSFLGDDMESFIKKLKTAVNDV